MPIKALQNRPNLNPDSKSEQAFAKFQRLLDELKRQDLNDEVVTAINEGVDQINAIADSGEVLHKQIKKTQSEILKLLEKEVKIVPKHYYRNLWMALGMAAFGIPMGVAFGMSLGNMAFLAIGLPIGLAIGIAVGTGMDKKAAEEGRQLDWEANAA